MRHYARTCRSCGHRWQIARALARERRPGRRALGRVGAGRAGGGLLQPFGGPTGRERRDSQHQLDAVVAERRAIVDRLERIDRNSRCPECGSREFDQRRA